MSSSKKNIWQIVSKCDDPSWSRALSCVFFPRTPVDTSANINTCQKKFEWTEHFYVDAMFTKIVKYSSDHLHAPPITDELEFCTGLEKVLVKLEAACAVRCLGQTEVVPGCLRWATILTSFYTNQGGICTPIGEPFSHLQQSTLQEYLERFSWQIS